MVLVEVKKYRYAKNLWKGVLVLIHKSPPFVSELAQHFPDKTLLDANSSYDEHKGELVHSIHCLGFYFDTQIV